MAKKKSKDRKKRRLYKRKGFWIFNLLCVCGALVALYSLDRFLEPYRLRALTYDLELIDDVEQPSLILDRHGREIGRMFVQNRSLVEIEEVPEQMINALLAQEDQRYFEHKGVDWVGVARAVYLNLKAGTVTQGASTITMQLARNAYDLKSEAKKRDESGMERKIVEAFLALRIEEGLAEEFPGEEGREAKMKILEYYLNRIPFGSGYYGIRSASLGYFGKEPRDLTIEECCSLVACVKNPATLSPLRDADANKVNRNHVLNRMLAEGMITESEWKRMKALPVKVDPKPLQRGTSQLYERVASQARSRLGIEALSRGGYRIHTTIDRDVQERLEKSLQDQLTAVEGREGYAHPKHADFERAEGRAPDYLQGAGLVIDSRTGDVVAHVGGRDYVHAQYDFIYSGKRPLGTAFLPFVYAAALEEGMHPSSIVRDEPMDNRAVMIGGREGILGEWGMETLSPPYEGAIPARRALATSKISASVRLGRELGLDKVVAHARKFGLTSESEKLLTRLLVGWEAASLPQVVRAYSAFSQGGKVPQRMRYLERIVDMDGKTVFLDQIPTVQVRNKVACSEETAYQVHSMLSDALESGNLSQYADELVDDGATAVLKTGTTHTFSDGWCIGYNGTLTFALWVGFLDGNEAVYENAFGRELTLPAGIEVMNFIARKFPGGELDVPGGLELVEVCLSSGLLKTRYCYEEVEHPELGPVQRPSSYRELLRKDREELALCDVHGVGGFAVNEALEEYGPGETDTQDRPRLAVSPIHPKAPVLVGTDPYNSVGLSLAPAESKRSLYLRGPSLMLDYAVGGDEEAAVRLPRPPQLSFEIPE